MARKTAKEKVQFVVIQNLRDGETIICLPKDLKKVKSEYFFKDSGRDIEDFCFYNVYEDNVWLAAQAPSIKNFYEERDE